MQYSTSIDDVAKILRRNNGGYANDWLIADTKKNEIASLELGLKNVTLERKKTGTLWDQIFRSTQNLRPKERTLISRIPP